MKYLTSFWLYIRRFKYPIILIVGFLYVGLIEKNSWLVRYNNQIREEQIIKEIDKYKDMHARNLKVLDAIGKDKEAMHKIAREKYFMKEQDEDIFVLSDDEQNNIR